MLGPTRIFLGLRRNADAGALAAVAAVAATFSATPFLIPKLVTEFGITLGQAGLISTAQVGAFAIVVFVAGRRLRTSRQFLVAASIASVLLNLASAMVPGFGGLLTLRVLAGGASGIMVWLSWAKAMRLGGPVRTVAAAGPLAVFLATPLIGWITASGGTDAVFVFLAVISLPSAILPAEFANYRHERSRLSPSRSNVILVIAMGLMTMSGSSLFIYAATVGETVGMTAPWLSAAFSGNALVGFIAARLKRGSGSGGSWLFGTALCAAAVGFSDRTPFILIALIMWGFCFWMATPRILQSIAAWSLAPDERVGDTQSAMAAGRALGPAIGGALIGAGTFGAVTTFSVVGLIAAGLIVIAVHHQRRGLTPPTST